MDDCSTQVIVIARQSMEARDNRSHTVLGPMEALHSTSSDGYHAMATEDCQLRWSLSGTYVIRSVLRPTAFNFWAGTCSTSQLRFPV